MSGSILSALAELTGSRARLLPASFRGAPFYMQAGSVSGGRRLVTHEFPLRDDAYTEDLGRLPRHFKVSAFVVDNPAQGTSYLDARDALLAAVEDSGEAGTLVHPTFGPLTCRAGVIALSERIVEAFGYAAFDLEFVVDDPTASPLYTTDTASSLLAGVASLLPVISAAYELVVEATLAPQLLLESAVDAMLDLPAGTISGLATTIAAVSAAPDDATATATAVQTAVQGMASLVVAANDVSTTVPDTVTGVALSIPAASDIAGGLADLASWGSDLPTIATTTASGASLAAQQTLVVNLVTGNAVAALVQVYASYDWTSAQQATAARTRLLDLIDAQALAAADAGSDDLFRAWNALESLATADMIARAQALPSQATYALPQSLPALVLAQLLLQDPTQADALADLNDAAQSLFMPAAGSWLQS